jgi:lysozyme
MNAERLAEQLVIDEGLRLKPYRCTAGRLSIGVGRNLDDRGITRDEALMLLRNDIDDFWGRLCAAQPWVLAAPEPVQEALTNMAFNLGLPGLLGFSRTLELLRNGQYAEAAEAMLASKWARQVGERARRLAEMVRAA